MNLVYKKCTIDDLDTLLKISRTTFVDAFEAANAPTDFKNYITSAFSLDEITIQLLSPNSVFYFAYMDDELVGYFKLNEKEGQKEHFDMDALELERIYVLKIFQGLQIGKQMLFKIIEHSKAKKASYLWLGVWEKNTAALRFYDRYGFKKFGKHPYLIGADEQYDWLMKLDIG